MLGLLDAGNIGKGNQHSFKLAGFDAKRRDSVQEPCTVPSLFFPLDQDPFFDNTLDIRQHLLLIGKMIGDMVDRPPQVLG